MEKIVTKYYCDICEEEVESKEALKEYMLPVEESDCEGRSLFPSVSKMDMCLKCAEKYRKMVYKHFAKVKLFPYDTIRELGSAFYNKGE